MQNVPLSVMLTILAVFGGQATAQTTGTIVIYRERGKNFGLIHYAQGEHPTIYCDDIKVARLRESHRITVSASVGLHNCVAIEKQYPGELNVDSYKVSIEVKANGTAYLRLQVPFGHTHFLLQEIPAETALAESAKTQPAKTGDSYNTVLPVTADKKPSS
jgi:hypothetical protein